MRLVLFEPDIPQNTGTMLRLGAALGIPVDLVEPCGFLIDDRRLRRAAMDYADLLDLTRWTSWRRYADARHHGRLVLLTTRSALPYTGFAFGPDDRIMVGRESAGAPDDVHDAADARLVIPLRPEARSINVATAAAMVLGEAIRQIRG